MIQGNYKINAEEDFVRMYDEYYGRVYNYVFFRLLNKEAAEDIVSETFIKAFTSRERYEPLKARLSTWIFTIAKNCLTDHYRKTANAPASFDGIPETACAWDLEEDIMDRMDKQNAFECLRKLDERERAAIYLKYSCGLTYREIAEHLSVTEKNVSVILTRSIKKIRAMLKKDENICSDLDVASYK